MASARYLHLWGLRPAMEMRPSAVRYMCHFLIRFCKEHTLHHMLVISHLTVHAGDSLDYCQQGACLRSQGLLSQHHGAGAGMAMAVKKYSM